MLSLAAPQTLSLSHTRAAAIVSAIKPRRASKQDGGSIAGDLAFAAPAAHRSDPPRGSSEKGGAPLRGSDVLHALQRATARKEKKRRRPGRKEKSDGGEEAAAHDGSGEVRPIEIRSDWGPRIEELEMQMDTNSTNSDLLSLRMELRVAMVKFIAFFMLCFSTTASTLDYADALEKSIIFFEAQRSGKLPHEQRVTWRGNSGLSDGSSQNVDLAGGYYDAGDNVKFGLPMAFTTTMLAWSVIEFGDLMKGQLQHAKAAIKWSTDYLIKAATATPDTLYVQVADPNMDHRCWERPEDMDTPRNVYKVTPQNPGSDVAAETAAALAAASIVFRDSDAGYSAKLLQTAIQVFHFADQYRGSYTDSLSSAACPFYCSYSGYHDELLWGASWLHKASANDSYMTYIETNGHTLGAEDDDYSFSWDDKRAGAKTYKVHADNYICSLVPGTPRFQSQYTPGGLLLKQTASNLQYVTSTAFLLLTYAKYLNANGGAATCGSSTLTTESLTSLAKKQVDYILGQNPAKMSYMIGFGERYPQYVHHRGSSIPSVHAHPSHVSCNEGFSYLYSSSPNPNILTGAVLGGPDNNDHFSNDRNNYQQSEPATYINAPMVGVLAFFAATPLAG
ncbi:hypothetical protein J5N97_029264 [Dioscorea zingiberensis]|uniref:Endoglucanase n=1 Tax=Dioscorea zingiberensis TaxID=325984 RepID=A0A9D5H5R7_9LILI|nr:hypothetical protein J5N97_029264 [Dioscorea zingiberensis]